jgi:hypothetical protein
LRKKKNLKEKKTRIKFDITHWYFFREFMREIKERRRKKNKLHVPLLYTRVAPPIRAC